MEKSTLPRVIENYEEIFETDQYWTEEDYFLACPWRDDILSQAPRTLTWLTEGI